MKSLSIRTRLTIAFAASLLAVLILAAVFVYLRVDDSLTGALDDRLEIQLAEVAEAAAGDGSLPGPAEAEDGFSQILEPDGTVVASNLPGGEPVLDAAALDAAVAGRLGTEELAVPGVDGDARVVAGSVDGPGGPLVVVAGASTEDRSEALAGIAAAFAIGAPLAVLLASLLGYTLASRAIAPMEAIRRRADEITLARSGERLPLPPANDEIRRLAETLNSMLDRIEASLEREREFVADASHELRTPLAVLRTELELALHPGRSEGEMRAALASAAEEVDRLSRLAEDLLVLARGDQDRLPVRLEAVRLAPLLERVAGRFADRARAAGRELSVVADPELEAELDPLRIEQAAGNLIDNALTHGEGAVTLTASTSDRGLRIEVADHGPGFPGGFEASAFDRFTRADEARTGGGAGLGLAIVRAIAAAHGGSATIVAGPDGGVVRLEFPRSSHRHLIERP